MKRDSKSFQERYEAWKNGADYWKDIRGINLGGDAQEELSDEDKKKLDDLVTNILAEYDRGKGQRSINDTVNSFVYRMGPLVGKALNRYGYDANTYYNVMRLLAYESKYGTSDIARNLHNYGGVGYNGKTYTTYKSDEDFVNNYVSLMRRKYNTALRAKSVQDYARALKSGGYYKDTLENYTRNLMGMNTLTKAAFTHRKLHPDMYNYLVKLTDLIDDYEEAKRLSPVMRGVPTIEKPQTINAAIPRTLLGPTEDLNKAAAENFMKRKMYEDVATPTIPLSMLLPLNNFGKDAYGLKFWWRRNNNLHFDKGKDYNSWSKIVKIKAFYGGLLPLFTRPHFQDGKDDASNEDIDRQEDKRQRLEPRPAAPSKDPYKRRSWETDEDYNDRVALLLSKSQEDLERDQLTIDSANKWQAEYDELSNAERKRQRDSFVIKKQQLASRLQNVYNSIHRAEDIMRQSKDTANIDVSSAYKNQELEKLQSYSEKMHDINLMLRSLETATGIFGIAQFAPYVYLKYGPQVLSYIGKLFARRGLVNSTRQLITPMMNRALAARLAMNGNALKLAEVTLNVNLYLGAGIDATLIYTLNDTKDKFVNSIELIPVAFDRVPNSYAAAFSNLGGFAANIYDVYQNTNN